MSNIKTVSSNDAAPTNPRTEMRKPRTRQQQFRNPCGIDCILRIHTSRR